MRQAKLYRYQIATDSGVILRNHRLAWREGLILLLQEGDQQGWGEAAPLPYFSHETLDEVESHARVWLTAWQRGETPNEPTIASLAFATSMALAELNNTLPTVADYQTVPLCYGDPDALLYTLSHKPGPKIAKLKVGFYEAVRDGIIVNTLLEAIPELTLRLDANRQWSTEKADKFARTIRPELRKRIIFIEEPCQTVTASRDFAKQHNLPLAWDETAQLPNFQVQAEENLAAIIIKPTLIGSLTRCQQLIHAAHQQGLAAVISASLESSLGLTQLARLSTWLTPNTPPGLDTLNLMQAQLLRPWPNSTLPLLDERALTLLADYA